MNPVIRKYGKLLKEEPELDAYIRQLEERSRLAYEDLVTKLGNKRLFNDDLADALDYAGRLGFPLTLGMLDLNGFKPVNDTYGHPAGDWVLKRVGETIRGYDNAYRTGGDEFGLILPFLDKEDAYTFACRLSDRIKAIKIDERQFKPFKETKEELNISASIGLATYPDDALNMEGLITLADERMYRAKRSWEEPRIEPRIVCMAGSKKYF